MKHLALLLGLKRYEVVGLMESLWHFAASYAKRGDIGRWTNHAIASAIEWSGEPDALVAALVESKLVDDDPVHRLIVHDWEDHCDQTVGRSDEVRKLGFARKSPTNPSAQLDNASEQLAEPSAQLEKTVKNYPALSQSHKPEPKSISHKPEPAEKPGPTASASPPRGDEADAVDIPRNLDTPAFRAKWHEWQSYRKQKRAKLTPMTAQKQLTELSRIGPDAAIATIEKSICKGWQGLFPEKNGQGQDRASPGVTHGDADSDQADTIRRLSHQARGDRKENP